MNCCTNQDLKHQGAGNSSLQCSTMTVPPPQSQHASFALASSVYMIQLLGCYNCYLVPSTGVLICMFTTLLCYDCSVGAQVPDVIMLQSSTHDPNAPPYKTNPKTTCCNYSYNAGGGGNLGAQSGILARRGGGLSWLQI